MKTTKENLIEAGKWDPNNAGKTTYSENLRLMPLLSQAGEMIDKLESAIDCLLIYKAIEGRPFDGYATEGRKALASLKEWKEKL